MWLVWLLLVATHYFTVPDELLRVADTTLRSFPHAGSAALRAARAIAGAAVVLLAAWGTGALVTRLLFGRIALHGTERLLVGSACGFAALSAGLLGLAFLNLYRPKPVSVAVAVVAIAGAIDIARCSFRVRSLPMCRARDVPFVACSVAAVGCAFVGALAPETEYDALWYHLWLPVQWLQAGGPVDIVHEYPSLYPLSWELLGGSAYVVGGPAAAKLLHFVCLPLLGLVTSRLTCSWFPSASTRLAAALAMATPITIWEATTAYVDLALAFNVAVSLYALTRYHGSRDRRWLIASAAVMGAALAVKHLGLVALAIATCVLLVLELRRSRRVRESIAASALFAAVALAVPAPWYARAFAASGNPVFPDMYRLFGGAPAERWSEQAEQGLQVFKDRFGTPRDVEHLLRLPWDMTVHAARFGGTLGPLFLILVPPALIGRGVRRTAWMVAAGCAAYLAVWASPISSFQMRFVIPLLPVLAALGAEGTKRVRLAAREIPGGGALVTGVVPVLLLFNLPPTSGWHEPDREGDNGWMTHIVRALPLGVVLGAESDEDYLARTVPSYPAWRFVNSALPADVRILTFSGGDHLYSERPRIWSDSVAARPATWGAPAGEERRAADALRALGITHVLFDKRQLEHGEVSTLALASQRMRTCCLVLAYEDSRFALYRVRGGGLPVGGER